MTAENNIIVDDIGKASHFSNFKNFNSDSPRRHYSAAKTFQHL